MEKTILVGCPTSALDPDPSRWLDSFIKIQNQIRALKMGQAFLAPYRMAWTAANNHIWENAIRFDFDYILRLDDDVHGVPDNAIEALLAADKDVIGAAYVSRHYPHKWCALNKSPEAKDKSLIDIAKNGECVLQEIQENTGIHRVDLLGFGMTLIKVASFKGLNKPLFFDAGEDVPDDTIFAQLCNENGIEQYVNMDIKISHRDISPLIRAKSLLWRGS